MKTESQIRQALAGLDQLGRQATSQNEVDATKAIVGHMSALEWVLEDGTLGAGVIDAGLAIAAQLSPERN